MDVYEAYNFLQENLNIDRGKFFASGSELSLGVGQLYAEALFPLFSDADEIFVTARGLVYVLTHECDIDQSNQRPFNSHVLVCPVIDFRTFVEEFQEEYSEDQLKNFLGNLGHYNIARLIYLPHWTPELPYGGLLYLNRITHSHVQTLRSHAVRRLCTVTTYGLRVVDFALTNHLLRPKAEVLPF